MALRTTGRMKAMRMAAEMPLPETSAMTIPRRRPSEPAIGKTSKKSPPISRAGR
jgi:hypothetical protein